MSERVALYFGVWDHAGHYLHSPGGRRHYSAQKDFHDCPWSDALMDTGLLRNGKHPDVIDGKVFWTCGGRPVLWHAFFWWDRSGDSRGNSCSGFYVRGFPFEAGASAAAAFAYACEQFPKIMNRQRVPLELQQ